MDHQAALQIISSDPDCKVIKRVQRPAQYSDLSRASDVKNLLVVDVETTGLDAEKEKIIELAAMLVEFSPSQGRLGKVLAVYNGFEDPGFPISPEIMQLTGITNEDVAGKSLDDAKILGMQEQANLVVAHNSSLDRRFIEARFPGFSDLWWACSYKEGPWEALQTGTAKQDYLVFKVGQAFYDAHRAINDVEALAHLLESPGADNKTVLRNILDVSRMPSFHVWLPGFPFDKKDELKARKYEWCGEDKIRNGETLEFKSWHKVFQSKAALDDEIAVLEEMHPGGRLVIDTLNGRDRYSNRIGEREDRKFPGKSPGYRR